MSVLDPYKSKDQWIIIEAITKLAALEAAEERLAALEAAEERERHLLDLIHQSNRLAR
jgi:hypothetical protein